MKKVFDKYNNLPKRIQDSIVIAATFVGSISTILSVLGLSLDDFGIDNIWFRIGIVLMLYLFLCLIIYVIIGQIFKESVSIKIRETSILISCGNIFFASGLRVIGCDTHFDTRVDDVVISKTSLHGQLFLEHGIKSEIEMVVENEASRLGLQKNDDGLYDFPLGTIIRYNSSIDNHTYLMLAMAKLNSRHEAHTDMAQFELMLMKMWREIDRVYAKYDVAFPILGTGISRFDDGPKDRGELLRCMLCTLNSSGVTLKSKVEILIFGDATEISLYEYKDMFRSIFRR